MKTAVILALACFLPASLCWEYPGYPGVDCPTARRHMLAEKDTQWMIPKCHDDGSFADLQCFEDHPDTCMCVAPDGSPLTLPGFGLKVKTCACLMAQYKIFEHDPGAEMPKCANDGSYELFQCSRLSGECWCVDKNGKILIPPSKNLISCSLD